MARGKANVAITPNPDEMQALDLTGLETADELNPALERLYAEMGADQFGKIKVYIYKIDPATGKEPRVWEGVPGDYDVMAIAKRFGSGDYRVKVHVPHESGRIVIGANTVFPILLDPAEDARIEAMRKGEVAAAAQVAQPALTAEQIAALVVQAVKAAMPQQHDPLAQMDRLAGVMAKLMPQHAPAQQGNSFMETLNAAKSLMELSRGMNPPVDGEGRTDVRGHALSKGIDVLTRMFEKGIEQAQSGARHNPAKSGNGALPAPDAQQAQAGSEAELTEEQREELEMLRVQIKMVNRKAKENADTIALADEFYEMLPDQVFDLIVFEPQWFEVLCANVPECAQHKPWYEKMRAAIIAKGIKEGDLKALPDGTLTFVEEPGDTNDHGASNAGNVPAGTAAN